MWLSIFLNKVTKFLGKNLMQIALTHYMRLKNIKVTLLQHLIRLTNGITLDLINNNKKTLQVYGLRGLISELRLLKVWTSLGEWRQGRLHPKDQRKNSVHSLKCWIWGTKSPVMKKSALHHDCEGEPKEASSCFTLHPKEHMSFNWKILNWDCMAKGILWNHFLFL